jgi:hypothetical protein
MRAPVNPFIADLNDIFKALHCLNNKGNILVKKLILITTALFILAATVVLYPRLSLIFSIKYDFSRSNMPGVYLVPVKRTVQVPATDVDEGNRLVSKWFTFEAPGSLVKKFDSEVAQAFEFDHGQRVLFSRQSEKNSIVKALLGKNPEEAAQMRLLLGEGNLQSEYAVINFCLHTTPEQAGFFSSKFELTRIQTMLILKSVFSRMGEVIYKFNLRQSRGFQFGDPAMTDQVYVYLFDDSDQMFRMQFVAVTQAEIDSLLTSIKNLSTSPLP